MSIGQLEFRVNPCFYLFILKINKFNLHNFAKYFLGTPECLADNKNIFLTKTDTEKLSNVPSLMYTLI